MLSFNDVDHFPVTVRLVIPRVTGSFIRTLYAGTPF